MATFDDSYKKTVKPAKTYSLVELVKGPRTDMIDHGPDDTIFAFPAVALLELLLALGLVAVLLMMSIMVNAPLEEVANPNQTTDPAKAPWYFMGLQEMLEHGHPTLMAVVLPGVMAVFVALIPYLDNSAKGTGRWFTSRRGKRITGLVALYTAIIMPIYIVLDTEYPLREIMRGQMPDFVLQVVIPLILMAVLVLLPLLILLPYKPDAREVMLVLFTVLFVSAVIFSVVGFLFRGPGFELYAPWNMPPGYNPFDHL